ncbi:hypothetical protein NQD34_008292 [Periophthalmus magnuspinnatus]|nr:hypothetical protein NQD34_008292 [Periophthalmus magnuspinnatus]
MTAAPVNFTNGSDGSPLLHQDHTSGPPTFYLPYFIYCCILGLVSCSVFLRINYELKMLVMLVALVIYNIIILQTHAPLLDRVSNALTDTLDRQVRASTSFPR